MAKSRRVHIPAIVQDHVLTQSRRRCAICFGLNRDMSIKQGQIAHLDDDPSNPHPDNLVFLCLAHHDEFDSSPRQSKGLTIGEVRRFRKELQDTLHVAMRREVQFGELKIVPPDDFSGEWLRMGDDEDDSAELTIQLVAPARIHVSGWGLHGRTREFGPNMGELDFEAPVADRTAQFMRQMYEDRTYTLTLRFEDGKLVAKEDGWGPFGQGVYFGGRYERVG
jgi:hypothetical protein